MSLFMKRGSAALYPPRIACYVCGAEVPSDYPLYPEPPPGCDLLLPSATPHFPFLLHHPPPLGCRPPSPGGMAKSCRVCYSTLMRQWEDYEKSAVPLERRIYWFERMDGMPVVTPELQVVMLATVIFIVTSIIILYTLWNIDLAKDNIMFPFGQYWVSTEGPNFVCKRLMKVFFGNTVKDGC